MLLILLWIVKSPWEAHLPGSSRCEDKPAHLPSGACLTPALWQEFTFSQSHNPWTSSRQIRQHPEYTLVCCTNSNPKQSLETSHLRCSTIIPAADLRWQTERWEAWQTLLVLTVRTKGQRRQSAPPDRFDDLLINCNEGWHSQPGDSLCSYTQLINITRKPWLKITISSNLCCKWLV